jgi:hypothetical protein
MRWITKVVTMKRGCLGAAAVGRKPTRRWSHLHWLQQTVPIFNSAEEIIFFFNVERFGELL